RLLLLRHPELPTHRVHRPSGHGGPRHFERSAAGPSVRRPLRLLGDVDRCVEEGAMTLGPALAVGLMLATMVFACSKDETTAELAAPVVATPEKPRGPSVPGHASSGVGSMPASAEGSVESGADSGAAAAQCEAACGGAHPGAAAVSAWACKPGGICDV